MPDPAGPPTPSSTTPCGTWSSGRAAASSRSARPSAATAALRDAADHKLFVLVGFARDVGCVVGGDRRGPRGDDAGRAPALRPQAGVGQGRQERLLGGHTARTRFGAVILSDRTIREAIAAGRIELEPCRRLADPAGVGRRAARPLLPGVPQPHDARHRREEEPRGAHPPRRDRRRRPLRPPPRRVRPRRHPRAGGPARTTSWPAIEGKSSLGRLGLLIHSTAGFIDPGWTGTSRWSCRTWPTCRSRSTRA